jgi:hypothetical protein
VSTVDSAWWSAEDACREAAGETCQRPRSKFAWSPCSLTKVTKCLSGQCRHHILLMPLQSSPPCSTFTKIPPPLFFTHCCGTPMRMRLGKYWANLLCWSQHILQSCMPTQAAGLGPSGCGMACQHSKSPRNCRPAHIVWHYASTG